jgi:hypothetical protein
MELALILRELTTRRRIMALGVLVAVIAAVLSVYRLDGLSLKPRALQHSSASTRALVDTSSSALGNVEQSFEGLQSRAAVYANFMASPVFLEMIGKRVGIAGNRIYAAGPVNPLVPRIVQEPTAVERNVEITGETSPYRLNFSSEQNLPTVGIYAQAPTTKQAMQLANAAVVSLEQYVSSLESEDHVAQGSRVVVRQLGEASGGVSDSGISKKLAATVFILVFLIWCVLMLVATRFLEAWRASAAPSVSAELVEPEAEAQDIPFETQDVPFTIRTPGDIRSPAEKADRKAQKGKAERSERVLDTAGGPVELHTRLPARSG